MRKFHSTTSLERAVWAMISIATLLIVWQISAIVATSNIFPTPLAVLSRLSSAITTPIGTMTIQMHILYSLSRVAVGVTAGSVAGILLGLVMGMNASVRAFVIPIFNMVRPIPTVAWIPLSIMWFGLGEETKWFLIFISSFTGCTIQSFSGVRAVDEILMGAARMLGASEARVFKTIVLPSCLPDICLGVQGALSAGWATVVAAEMVRSSEGVGWLIIAGQNNLDMGQILVGIVVIGCVGAVITTIASILEGRLLKWNK